ncbi:MAG: Sec-independent protein translocase protein TatB [Sulfurimonadaceae bacterium]|jgi:sec-independent protein translocase protein TatB|nr:Sec-independent protein translocase protein TatB [Sulfurimonadaceae bacterium]
MFDMGFSEIIVIAIIAIVFLGPDKLPEAMVKIAKLFKSAKSTINSVKSTFEAEMSEVKSIKDEALAYKKELLDSANQLKKDVDMSDVASSITSDINDIKNIYDKETPATKPDEITLKKKEKNTQEEPKDV